jgi:hypothetical protein
MYTNHAFTGQPRQKMVKNGKKVKFYRRFRTDQAILCVHAFQYQLIVLQQVAFYAFTKKPEFM